MSIQIIPKERQGRGAFNGGEIVENKPISFPREGGITRPYSNLFYWAHAQARIDSTIGLHPHEGFEIITFVLQGNIRHYDTKMRAWQPLQAGDVQIIRAGNGISHSEFMEKDAAIFQIWLDPDLTKSMALPASYDDYRSADLPVTQDGSLHVKTYIGGASPFTLASEGIEVQELTFEKSDNTRSLSNEKTYSLYVMEGSFRLNGHPVKQDDFIILSDASSLQIQSEEAGKLFYIASPKEVHYQTYAQLMQERLQARGH